MAGGQHIKTNHTQRWRQKISIKYTVQLGKNHGHTKETHTHTHTNKHTEKERCKRQHKGEWYKCEKWKVLLSTKWEDTASRRTARQYTYIYTHL